MEFSVEFSKRAQRQLASLHRFIAKRSGDERAFDYVNRIIRLCEGLSTSPDRGANRGDIRKGMRSIGFERRALVVYAIKNQTVTIISVLYGGQDWPPR